MPIGQQGFPPRDITIKGSENPLITNINVTSTGTEFSHTFQDNLREFMIRHRSKGTIQFSFISGESNTNFFTIPAYANAILNGLDFESKTIYFQCSAVGIVEILELY